MRFMIRRVYWYSLNRPVEDVSSNDPSESLYLPLPHHWEGSEMIGMLNKKGNFFIRL